MGQSASMTAGAATWRDPAFREGLRDMVGTSIGIAAWGLVTGVAMVNSGLSVGLALTISLLVFAGSAQLAVMPLLSGGAPAWLIWATAACINLRFIILSTQWRPYFRGMPFGSRMRVAYFAADLNIVLFMRRFPDPRPAPEQWPYFWGGVALNWGAWQGASIAGILLAQDIPPHWGIGFAGTLALLAFTLSMAHDRSTRAAALVASCAAVAAYGLPLKLHLVVAIAAAVAFGLMVEHLRVEPRATGRA